MTDQKLDAQLPRKQDIVVVEDNHALRDDLCFQLEDAGFNVQGASSSAGLAHLLTKFDFDIVVLDLGLPDENGLSLAKRLRKKYPHIGVVMLTAWGEVDTRLEGYSSGADYYLVKPVDIRELIANIRVLLRRMNSSPNKLEQNSWTLRDSSRQLVTPGQSVINLTGMEALLIQTLVKEAGQPVSRMALIEALSREDVSHFDPHRLEVAISRLRRKIISALNSEDELFEVSQLPLKTIRGVGYMFSATVNILD